MSNIDSLLPRNAAFAASDVRYNTPRLPFLPQKGLYVITCIDPRVDPADKRQSRLPRLSRAQGARAHPYPCNADHRPQTRPPLLPHPPGARPCRARTTRPPLRPSPPITDALKTCSQLQQRPRHPPPAWRPTKDRAAAVAPPERPINHQITGRQPSRPRAQISKGVHGAKPNPHPASLRRIIHDRRATPSRRTHNLHHKHAQTTRPRHPRPSSDKQSSGQGRGAHMEERLSSEQR